MMKHLISLSLMLICAVFSVQAQHKVIVDSKVSGTGNREYAEILRSKVMSTFSKVGFVRIMDSNTTTNEEADYSLSLHLDEILDLGKRSDTDFKYRYKAPFVVKIIKLSDNSVKATQTFNTEGYSDDSMRDAILSSLDKSMPKVLKFVNEKLPIEGELIDITEAKGNKAQSVYISLGSQIGITKGQELEVKAKAMIAGKPYLKSLGRIKVQEVEGEEGSRCKVTDGHEKILKEYNDNPDNIVVVTMKGWGIGDWWKTN